MEFDGHKIERVFDHCEQNHTHSDWVAEFWNTSTSLAFVGVGILFLRLHKQAYLEQRYSAISYAYILCGITGFVAHATLSLPMVKFDHIVFTTVVLLNTWLIHGDEYLLIFWQIHLLAGAFVTAVWDWFFPVHMLLVGAGTIWALNSKMDWVPSGTATAMPVMHLAVVMGLAAYGLMSSDHVACNHRWALPQMHAMGQVVAAGSMYASTVCSAYLRMQERKVPSDVAYTFGCIPYVVRLSKDHSL